MTGGAGRSQREDSYNTGDQKEEMMVLELIACQEKGRDGGDFREEQ